jgi:hypothetical protein
MALVARSEVERQKVIDRHNSGPYSLHVRCVDGSKRVKFSWGD